MLDTTKLALEQEKLAAKVILTNAFEQINLVGGIDTIYSENLIFNAIIIIDAKTKEIVERQFTHGHVSFPYIPGFLSYRESSTIMDTYEKLSVKPDMLFVNGNGILHPRRFGLASYIGLALDIPAIGIAKNKLFGSIIEDSVYIDKDCVGKILATKSGAKPIYVSQGHKISLKSACEFTKEWLTDYKMPYPLHAAHMYAAKIKNKIKNK